MHARKTGALIRAAAVAGAIMAGADDGHRAPSADTPRELGLAFQIVDDILDVEGATERPRQDRRQGRGGGQADLPGALRPRPRRGDWRAQAFDDALAALERVATAAGARCLARASRDWVVSGARRETSASDDRPMKIARSTSLVVERGLVPSRERARALILAGQVRVDGHVASKAGDRRRPPTRASSWRSRTTRTSAAAASSSRTRSTRSASTSRAARRSTSARPPAASPTCCCAAAPCAWSRSTSATASSTGGSAATRASS